MFRRLKYLLPFILCINNVFGQILPFKNYTVKDGLISDHVTAITQDKRGLLWIGTSFGINWFDGNHMTKPAISLKTGQLLITNFFRDRKQNIWILSFYNGLYKYDYASFHNYLPDSLHIESNSNNVLDMLQYDDKNFLVATDQNVFWFDGKSFQLFDDANSKLARQINTVALYRGKWLLFGHSHGVFIYQLVGSNWKYKGQLFENVSINRIITDNDELWIASDSGLFLLKDEQNILAQKPTRSFFASTPVSEISKNPGTGEIWVNADKLYRLRSNELTSYDDSNGLPAIPARTFIDEEGILWMCSRKGMIKMASQHYVFYDLTKGPANAMTTDIADAGTNDLWFGTYDGLGHKRNNHVTDHRRINGKRIGYVAWIKKTKRYGMLAGTETGVIMISGERIKMKFDLKSTKVLEEDDGTVWLGTEQGTLFRIKNDSLCEFFTEPAWGDFIDALYKEPAGYLWVGYRGTGIKKYQVTGDRGKLVKEFSTRTGYNDLRIRCCSVDKKGNILFGTRTNGLFIISLSNNEKTWHINSSKGLSANWVRSIANDQDGNLYLATSRGVNLLGGSYDNPVLAKLNLPNDEPGEQTTCLDPANDKLWIGTEGGVIEYYPTLKNNDNVTPATYFTEISINGIRDSSIRAYTMTGKKRLRAGNNTVAFEFAGIYHAGDAPLLYRYRLDGQDDEWIYAGERNFVSYNLRPGNYIFRVESSAANGVWSNRAASYRFLIPTPFWKQWWFIPSIAICLIGLLFFFYRYQLQQQLKLERLRQKISRDLHDDIGSTLSSISILSDIATGEKDQRQTGYMMQEIKQSSVTLMEKMDDIVWSINPDNDTMENLMIRIRRFASRLFEARAIDYTIEIDTEIHHARPGMETRQHIYLIMKEIINNLVKYSGCTKAYIGVKYENKIVRIEIKDNGKGFDLREVKAGNGMISMVSRAKLIGAELKISSMPGEGSEFLLQTKIK